MKNLSTKKLDILNGEHVKDFDIDRGRLWVTRARGGVCGEYAVFRDTLRLLKLYLQHRDGDLHLALFLSIGGKISRKAAQALADFVGATGPSRGYCLIPAWILAVTTLVSRRW